MTNKEMEKRFIELLNTLTPEQLAPTSCNG